MLCKHIVASLDFYISHWWGQGFLLFTLLVSDKRVNYASKLLGIQCLLIATSFVLPLIVAVGEIDFAWLISFLVFLPVCYGALGYLYCRAAITGSSLKYNRLQRCGDKSLFTENKYGK